MLHFGGKEWIQKAVYVESSPAQYDEIINKWFCTLRAAVNSGRNLRRW